MSLFSRLRHSLHPRRLDEDIAEEARDHMERRKAQWIAEGLEPEEAARRAAVAFGNMTRIQERSREIRLWSAVEGTLQDLRYAVRGMRKSPAFTLTAILSLSLAIGANTAIYSIVEAAILRPLPVPEPGKLFALTSPDVQRAGADTTGERANESFSYPMYQEFRTAAGGSARLGLFTWASVVEVQIPDRSAPIETATRQIVSGDAFEILNVPPAVGRVFSQEDDRTPGGHPVAVISHEYWRRRFHGDAAVVGQRLRLGTGSYVVVGVAREGFTGVEPGKFVDVWLTAAMSGKASLTNAGWSWFRIVGRLAPDATREQIQARLQPVFHTFMEDTVKRNPTMPEGIRKQLREMALRVRPAEQGVSEFRQTFAKPLWIVLAIAAGILLIACANVASLLLARATARSSEMAMRISLGAGRARLVRQLLTENLLLSLVAGAAAWLMARMAAPVLVAMLSSENDPVQFALSMDTRVLLFCAAISTLAAMFFGLLPAWQASGARPMLALRGAQGSAGRLRLGRFFVSVQVAFAFCLVITGAGFLYSLRNLFLVDTGFDSRRVSLIQIADEWPAGESHRRRDFMNQLRTQVAALPGVQGTATAPWGIFENNFWTEQIVLPGKAPSEREELFYRVSPGYFAALRTPLLGGRDFQVGDREDPKTKAAVPTIVNLAFARRYFGAENPVGKTFERPKGSTAIRHEIVGIAGNAKYGDLRSGPEPMIYLPIDGGGSIRLYVRSALDLPSVVSTVEREAKAIAPGVRVRDVTPLETLVGNTILKEKLLAGIGGVFAALGLLLAAIGLFGLLNYSVARRTKEIGIRSALGAGRSSILGLVWKDLFAMLGGGLAAGLAGSIATLTALQTLLFGIRPADPVVLLTATLVFGSAVLLAGTLPALRAAAIDPMIALRHE